MKLRRSVLPLDHCSAHNRRTSELFAEKSAPSPAASCAAATAAASTTAAAATAGATHHRLQLQGR